MCLEQLSKLLPTSFHRVERHSSYHPGIQSFAAIVSNVRHDTLYRNPPSRFSRNLRNLVGPLALILFDNVHYCYPQTAGEVVSRVVVRRWSIAAGECVALIGASGSGKTTLLQLAGGILGVAGGSIQVAQQSLGTMPEARRRKFRLANIGFVFQSFELLPHLTVEENLLLPIHLLKPKRLSTQVQSRVDELCENLSLSRSIRKRRPDRLSQGERQRVAIGRALVTQPSVVLADEPTGNLDPALKRSVVELLLNQCRENNATLVMATHDLSGIDRFDSSHETSTVLQWEGQH